jgi:hypothetical protein
MTKPFDVVDFIIEFESGNLNMERTIKGFQYLINTRTINNLQGSYQRMAQQLIDNGLCEYPPTSNS